MTQDAAVAAAKGKVKGKLLKNGNGFTKPIVIDGQKYMLHKTCPFDLIVQILTSLSIDSQKYLHHVE